MMSKKIEANDSDLSGTWANTYSVLMRLSRGYRKKMLRVHSSSLKRGVQRTSLAAPPDQPSEAAKRIQIESRSGLPKVTAVLMVEGKKLSS